MKLSDAVKTFLAAPRFAALATLNPDGSPHLTVIWYEPRADEVLVNTTAERVKRRNLSRDGRVSLLVGDGDTYVRLDGSAREVAVGEHAREDIRRLAIRYEGSEVGDRNFREIYSKRERVSYAITISRVYTYGLE